MIDFKIIKRLNSRSFLLLFYVVLLSLALLPYYKNGTIILGGEGDVILNFTNFLHKYFFTWCPDDGVGVRNFIANIGLDTLIFSFMERLTGSVALTNFLLIFSIYFFPFLGLFLVGKELKVRPFISFMVSLFYIVNPFMLYYLTCINQWNVFAVTIMPMFLWIILKYYHSNVNLFIFSGLISAVFSFAYSNQPLFGVIQISIILSMFLVSYYYNRKFIISQILKKYGLVLSGFILFNFWWVLNLLAGGILAAKKTYVVPYAEHWLDAAVKGHGAIIAKMFSLTTIIGGDSAYDFFSYWYNTIPGKLITLIPIFAVLYFISIAKRKNAQNAFSAIVFLSLVIILFFVKGTSGPFGFIYRLMFKYVPLFNIFKSPVEKFGLLYVFVFSILLFLALQGLEGQRYYRFIIVAFAVYLIFCSVPMLSGNIIPDNRMPSMGMGYGSRKYKDKNEYGQFRESVNNDNVQYRVFSLPSAGNYQVCLANYGNKNYTGLDPVLYNINKPFLALHHEIDILIKNISGNQYMRLLGIYNIGKIMINEDIIPFATIEKESVPELKRIFSQYMAAEKWGSITLYDNKDYFLPRIYVSVDSN